MAIFTGTAGADSFIGADAEADTFRFTVANLAANDTLSGGSAAGIIDILLMFSPGNLPPAVLAGVTGIERVQLSAGSNALTLTLAMQTSAQDRTVEIRGSAGADTVAGSGSADATLQLRYFTGTDSTDRFTGGAGNDLLVVQGAGSLYADLGGGADLLQTDATLLDATDTLLGGLGLDRLQFLDAGTITAASLANVSGFEEFQLAGGTGSSLTLNTAIVTAAGGFLTVIGGSEASQVDASAVASGRILYRAGAGADTMQGGAGNDTVESSGVLVGNLGGGRDTLQLASAAAAAGSVDGGAGFDTLALLNRGLHVLTAYAGFERVTLALNASVVMSTTAGQELWGSDFNDAVTLGGADQTVLADLGNDIVTVSFANHFGAVLDGGGQTTRDTLLLQGAGTWNLRSEALVTGFERIAFDASTAGSVITLGNQAAEVRLGAEARVAMGIAASQKVVGSQDNDAITLGAAGQVVLAGAGADTVTASVAQLLGGAEISGGSGSDLLALVGGGTLAMADVTATGFETVMLASAAALTTLAQPTTVVGSAGGDTIIAGGASSTVRGEGGNDVLRTLGAGTTLNGGDGIDTFVFEMEDQAAWTGAPLTLIGGTTNFVIDTLQVNLAGSGTALLDLTRHAISAIDRVVITGTNSGGALVLTIGDALVATADGNNGGISGDFDVDASGFVGESITVNAGGLTGNNFLRFNPDESTLFGGQDSVTGGDSSDVLRGNLGNDTLRGGGGNDILSGGEGLDSLEGGTGNDQIFGGNADDSIDGGGGADIITGGSGGDVITLTETTAAADQIRFTSINDGSVDINNTVAEATADRIIGFNPANDTILLNRAGLGLGSGGVASVPANGVWNLSANAVFIFESNSVNSDTLGANNFGAFSEIAFAINSDNGSASGSTAGRTVGLVVSNVESLVARRTGLYVWTDTNGNNALEDTDVVRLLGVLEGVTANQLSSLNVLIG
jgi:Ca2+-binding RTX toxin-like protein